MKNEQIHLTSDQIREAALHAACDDEAGDLILEELADHFFRHEDSDATAREFIKITRSCGPDQELTQVCTSLVETWDGFLKDYNLLNPFGEWFFAIDAIVERAREVLAKAT